MDIQNGLLAMDTSNQPSTAQSEISELDRPPAYSGPDPNHQSTADERQAPFIIWTFRRTGGTSLRGLLFWLSPFGHWQDEAFNVDRELGGITSSFTETGVRDALDTSTAEFSAKLRNLKHCIETVPYEVSSSLLRATATTYRHVILLRGNEVDRQLSLQAARISNAWGVEHASAVYENVKSGEHNLGALNLSVLRRQVQDDALILGRMLRKFHELKVLHSIVFFEDLYTGEFEQRVSAFRGLCRYLHLNKAEQCKDDAFRTGLMERSQGTADIYQFFDNFEEARRLVMEYIS